MPSDAAGEGPAGRSGGRGRRRGEVFVAAAVAVVVRFVLPALFVVVPSLTLRSRVTLWRSSDARGGEVTGEGERERIGQP